MDQNDSGAKTGLSLSRRSLLKRSSLAAAGAVVGGSLFGTNAAFGAKSSPFADSTEVRDVLANSIKNAIASHPLELPEDLRGAVIGIDITDPRAGVAIKVGSRASELIKESASDTTSGAILSARTMHDIFRGQVTPAYALANGDLVLVGNRAELSCLHGLACSIIPFYEKEMKRVGKASSLSINEREVV